MNTNHQHQLNPTTSWVLSHQPSDHLTSAAWHRGCHQGLGSYSVADLLAAPWFGMATRIVGLWIFEASWPCQKALSKWMINPGCSGTCAIIVTVSWWDPNSLLVSSASDSFWTGSSANVHRLVLFNNALSATLLGFPNSEGFEGLLLLFPLSLSLSLSLSLFSLSVVWLEQPSSVTEWNLTLSTSSLQRRLWNAPSLEEVFFSKLFKMSLSHFDEGLETASRSSKVQQQHLCWLSD